VIRRCALHPRRCSCSKTCARADHARAAALLPPPSSLLPPPSSLHPPPSSPQIKRAYRALAAREHPDKGGDPARFRAAREAYAVLADAARRARYDATGRAERTPEEDFVAAFAGGAYADRGAAAAAAPPPALHEQLALREDPAARSHSAGFEAWMRARGDAGVKVFTTDDVVAQFGVARGSYEAVPLPRVRAHAARARAAGPPKDVIALGLEALPAELEWGRVLVSWRAAPVNPADLYTIATGGQYGPDDAAPAAPFVPGHDGVGVIVKAGPGVTGLAEGDWVAPLAPHAGTWRALAAAPSKDLLRLEPDFMPLEQAALLREMVTAYRLLEEAGLKPGDAVLLNAPTGAVGQLLIQLCRLLRLRAVAVAADRPDFAAAAGWLRALGAAEVLREGAPLRAALERAQFYAKPRLALDAVGGASGLRLAEALADGGEVVVYGCLSGAAPAWPWRDFVFRGLRVRGFNARRWMREQRARRLPPLLEALGKLVRAGKLAAVVAEYELATELDEAIEHALERGRNAKVILRVNDVGEYAGEDEGAAGGGEAPAAA
jgi:trans-2-enoyl-CoA reductase